MTAFYNPSETEQACGAKPKGKRMPQNRRSPYGRKVIPNEFEEELTGRPAICS